MLKNENSKQIAAPYPLAMVIADAVWKDPSTGKLTILGCFSALFVKEFPAVVPSVAVYIALTDAQGRIPIILKLIDADEERAPVFEAKSMVEFPDRRAVVQLALAFQNLQLMAPGEYRFQLYAGDEPLMERRILVINPAENNHDSHE